jgi:acyl transferase domain-containing protein
MKYLLDYALTAEYIQPQYAATGNGIAIMSNRISWFYDLRGPSMTLDTGCSASLVGVHLACQSLRAGESTMVCCMHDSYTN